MTYKTNRQREEALERRLDQAGICSGLFDCDCACAAAPDYSSVASASKESAQIMADLGREQLAESKRQYDLNRSVAQPVADAQLELMKQSKDQGDDYFNYMKQYSRPTEIALNDEAMKAGSQQMQDDAAGKAIADTRTGSTSTANMLMRQGLRYGMSPTAMAARMGDQSTALASAEASVANAAREKEKASGFAKKMDVAGLYRNLSGASQGAYNLAINSGNSAVDNTMKPGQALISGNASGAGIIGTGQQLQLQGLGNVLSAQTSYANSVNRAMNSGGSSLGGLGSLLGGAASLYSAYMAPVPSSERIKTNKQRMKPVLAGVRNLKIDDWKYKPGAGDEGEHSGPYAEDVRRELGNRVAPGGKAIDPISMHGVTLKAIQELDRKIDRVAAGKAGKPSLGRVIEGKARRIK